MGDVSFYEELSQRSRDLEILNSLIQSVHKFTDLEEVYRVALDSVIELENIDMVMVYLVDERKREAVLQAHRNLPEDYIRRAERIPYPEGVTWKVINTGRMLNMENVQKDPDIRSVGRDLGHHGVLGIPIFLEEKVIGVIWFISYKERKFNEREVSLLSTLGNQIAVAISKAKQRKELELINKDLSALNTIATTVHRSLSLKEVYSIALDTVLGITAFDIAMIYLVDENTNEAVLQSHRGLTEDYIRKAGRIPYPKGVTWKVINSGELTLIDDIQKDPDLGSAGRILGHHTMLIVPIKQEEKTIGIIGFASHRVLEFNSREVSLLNAIGSQIGTAIVQAYLYEDLNRKNKDLEILNTITQAVNQSPNLREIYGIALDKVIELESVDIACIYLVDEIKKEAVMQDHRNLPEEFIQRASRIPCPKGVTWKVINTGEILNVKNAEQDPNVGPAGRDLGFRSMMGIPITLEGKTIGVTWLLSYREHVFTKSEEELLTSIGTQIAVVIARAKQTKELEERNRNLSILSAISQAVHQSIDLNQIYRTVLDVTKDLRSIDIMSVYLVEGEGDKREAVLQVHRGYREEYLKRASRIPYPKGVTWKVITSGEPVFYEDASDPSTVVGPAGKALGARAMLSIPVKSGSEAIGVVHFSSLEKTSFTQQELDFLLSLGNQIGTAIAKARMIVEIKQGEKAFKKVQERFSGIYNSSKDAIWYVTLEGILIDVNDSLLKLTGYSREELLNGKRYQDITPQEYHEYESKMVEKLLRTGEAVEYEKGYVRKDGSRVPVLLTAFIVKGSEGEPIGIAAIIKDITERKQAEEKIKAALEEKEVLLREIHHRVKNNLQVISSLLSLQSRRYTKSREVCEMLNESRNRIKSMALIHEQLYKSKNLGMIDCAVYIRNLVNHLLRSHGVYLHKINQNIKINDISLEIDTAIPLGLIINELVSNSLKYAFPAGREGKIDIELHSHGNGKFTLIVSDNGIGLPKDLDFRNTKSLGLKLVNTLTHQLDGTIELYSGGGTGFELTFRAK